MAAGKVYAAQEEKEAGKVRNGSGRPSSDLASASMAGVWGCLGAARALPGRARRHRVDGVWAVS